jgi:hypothetical protein
VVITTSGFFSTAPFLAALLTFGADRILFSVDYHRARQHRSRPQVASMRYPVRGTERAFAGVMNESEWTEVTVCAVCRAQLSPDVDRAFACGPDTYLCFECAEARGGVFDANEDRWIVAPATSGLNDERRPHP